MTRETTGDNAGPQRSIFRSEARKTGEHHSSFRLSNKRRAIPRREAIDRGPCAACRARLAGRVHSGLGLGASARALRVYLCRPSPLAPMGTTSNKNAFSSWLDERHWRAAGSRETTPPFSANKSGQITYSCDAPHPLESEPLTVLLPSAADGRRMAGESASERYRTPSSAHRPRCKANKRRSLV